MKKFITACLVAGFTVLGLADPMASNGKDAVTLRPVACSNPEVLAHIPAEYQKYFFNAEVHLQGKDYKSCWTIQGDNVFLAYPDGDTGVLPMTLFKEAGV